MVVVFSDGAAIAGDGTYPAAPELTIGRSTDCDIFIDDPALSRRHAALRFGAEAVTVRDLGSHNGTFVDGAAVAAGAEVSLAIAGENVIRCGGTLALLTRDVAAFAGWRRWGSVGPFVGGPAARRLLDEVRALAETDLEVLLLGESGTGKEVIATALHTQSGRPGPFVAVDCSAVPEPLFEAELFGALKGSYTGATADRPGLFRAAHGGTLFLDEIGDLPLALQAKLLRAVEQRVVRPVGGHEALAVDVRLVTATNRDLAADVERGRFRLDLYHRLNGARIQIPPLRERRVDIPLLVEHVLARAGAARPLAVSAAAMERLLLHRWPGNCRELDRVVREAAARTAAAGERQLAPDDLRAELRGAAAAEPANEADIVGRVKEALARASGNVTRAAQELGMHRSRVYTLLKERGLSVEELRGGVQPAQRS